MKTPLDNLPSDPKNEIPPPMDWSPVAVRLLQGVVYHDDNLETWEQLLENVSPLTEYFGKLGLLLVV
ncbi:MAG: hypothetical protein ACOVLE_17900, partial [Pirellula staleyi]